MANKLSRTIYITQEQDAGLEKLKRITRIPKSELHRMAIDSLFAEYAETLALEPGESPQLIKPKNKNKTFIIGDNVTIQD